VARPTNRYLRGFLSTFDAKVRGQAPAAFEEAVRPVIAVEPFLAAEMAETWRANTAALATPGFFPAATAWAANIPVPWIVPEQQLWLVHQFSITFLLAGASASSRCSIGLRYQAFAASAVIAAGHPQPEDDMPYSEADLKRIVAAAVKPIADDLAKVKTEVTGLKADYLTKGKGVRQSIAVIEDRTEDLVTGKRPGKG